LEIRAVGAEAYLTTLMSAAVYDRRINDRTTRANTLGLANQSGRLNNATVIDRRYKKDRSGIYLRGRQFDAGEEFVVIYRL